MENITKDECVQTHTKLMDKIDLMTDKIENIRIDIASMPGKLTQEMDGRYAVKSVEQEVEELTKDINKKNYEWLKYLIMMFATAIFSYFLYYVRSNSASTTMTNNTGAKSAEEIKKIVSDEISQYIEKDNGTPIIK